MTLNDFMIIIGPPVILTIAAVMVAVVKRVTDRSSE